MVKKYKSMKKSDNVVVNGAYSLFSSLKGGSGRLSILHVGKIKSI